MSSFIYRRRWVTKLLTPTRWTRIPARLLAMADQSGRTDMSSAQHMLPAFRTVSSNLYHVRYTWNGLISFWLYLASWGRIIVLGYCWNIDIFWLDSLLIIKIFCLLSGMICTTGGDAHSSASTHTIQLTTEATGSLNVVDEDAPQEMLAPTPGSYTSSAGILQWVLSSQTCWTHSLSWWRHWSKESRW